MDEVTLWNRRIYGNPAIVQEYAAKNSLFEGECAVLDILDDALPDMAVLDLGVGTGRTTPHLADNVRRYVGVDISFEMLHACARFCSHYPVDLLVCADASSLPFKTDSFDLVLFTYNGLDYIGHESRLKALREVRRVLRPGGRFVFSTHLLPRILRRFRTFGGAACWGRTGWKNRLRFRWYNRGLVRFKRQRWAIVRDASHNFALKTYYVMPEVALAQLCDAGFGTVRIFRAKSPEEIKLSGFRDSQDEWVNIIAQE